MTVSRRRFLHHSVLAAAACAAAPFSAMGRGVNRPVGEGPAAPNKTPAAPPKAPAGDAFAALGHMSRQNFVQAIGSSFKVTPASGNAAPTFLRLLAVDDLPGLVPVNPASFAVSPKSTSAPIVTTGFILSFAGTGTQPPHQGTYLFEHSTLGTFAMFVVPGKAGQQACTAVVNWLGAGNASVFQKR